MKRTRKRTSAESHRISEILESITDAFFALDREWRFTYLNDQAEKLLQRHREILLGRNVWDEFPDAVGLDFHTQYHRAVTERVAVSFNDYYPGLDTWFEVRAYPSKDGLSVYFHDITARKRLEAESARLLAETQQHARREALLNALGQVVRSSTDVETIQYAAVTLLGDALGADRCYYAAYDLERGTVTVAPDRHIESLPSIQGTYAFPNTATMFQELYAASNTSVLNDSSDAGLSVQTLEAMGQLQIRSRLSVALTTESGLMATLTAAMADQPREWTPEEVQLIESVATLLRSSAQNVRAQQREHRIAVQLQEALQPGLPGAISGLSVARFYEAALVDEAGVGGDFYDVFEIDKGCTVLVVGDLSGKGLAAATEVSVCRNMLRAFIYTQPSLIDAVSCLNRVMVEHRLLTGFTTLFVGTYDSGTKVLRYVNCGQEPALIRHSDGSPIEFLRPTGPVIGMDESSVYEEGTVSLRPADAVAIFSDGFTEVGDSRLELLGVDNLGSVFDDRQQTLSGNSDEAAEQLSSLMVKKVMSMSSHGVRDDMCLLVAVAQ